MIEKYHDGEDTPYEIIHDELSEDKPSAFVPCEYRIDKYEGDIEESVRGAVAVLERTGRRLRTVSPRIATVLESPGVRRREKWKETAKLLSVVEGKGNLLMYGGASNLWQYAIGNGTGTAAQTLTYFNNGNSYLGVGDSSTAAAATQTDLQASTNKTRVAMDATYPLHTPGTSSGAATITYRSSFTAANYAWNEWALFNGSSGGRMMNRKTFSGGTKASGTWVFTVTLTLA